MPDDATAISALEKTTVVAFEGSAVKALTPERVELKRGSEAIKIVFGVRTGKNGAKSIECMACPVTTGVRAAFRIAMGLPGR